MGRVFFGILLLGGGIYIAWEANSMLNWPLFQMGALFGGSHQLSSFDLQAMNSFLTDALHSAGATTFGEMQRYLSISRAAGTVLALLGLGILFSSRK